MTKFGLLFGLHAHPRWGPVSVAEVYSAVPAMAAAAEELGYDSVFYTEHHASPSNECPSPFVAAAAAAGATQRIVVGTGVALPAFYHPLKLAEDIAVLDNISRGRVLAGLGLGYRPNEFAAFGLTTKRRGQYLDEALDIVLAALAGGPFSYQGRHWTVEGFELAPPTVQRPVPIWVGAQYRRGFQRAVRLGLPVPLGVAPLPLAVRQRRKYQAELDAAEVQQAHLERPIIREAFVAETDDEAWRIAGPFIHNLFVDDYLRFGPLAVADNQGGYRPAHDPDDPALSEMRTFGADRVLVGSPATMINEIKRHEAELPCDHWVLRMHLPGMSPEVALRSMELFASEVLGSLREAQTTTEPSRMP